MKIQLSGTIVPMYGNPLGLQSGEIKDVEPTMEIEYLLRAGVYDYVISEKPIVEEKKVEKFITKTPIDLKLKGIGKKTLKDIKINFDSEESLKEALETGKVGLRDDVVEKLQKYYNIVLKK